jgi:hypothetical protein
VEIDEPHDWLLVGRSVVVEDRQLKLFGESSTSALLRLIFLGWKRH